MENSSKDFFFLFLFCATIINRREKLPCIKLDVEFHKMLKKSNAFMACKGITFSNMNVITHFN